MLDTRIGGHRQAYGYNYEHRRSSSYGCDENDSDSDCEAHQRNLRVSRFVGHVAERVVQPFERVTKKVVNPVLHLFFTPAKGKKGRQGRHENANYGGNGKQHHSVEKMQYCSGHEDANYGGHRKQHHSGERMQHYSGHEDANYGGHGKQHHSGERMQHYSGHEDANYGGRGKQHHTGERMQHYSGHEDAAYGAHVMKHEDRLMAPQVPPQYGYMNQSHGSGSGRAVLMKSSENSRVSNISCRKHKGG